MIEISPPSLPRLLHFLRAAAAEARSGRVLLLLPSALMRAEAERLLAGDGALGGLETTTPSFLASSLTGVEPVSPAVSAALALAAMQERSADLGDALGVEPAPERAATLASLFDLFRHEKLDPPAVLARFSSGPAAFKARLIADLYSRWLELLNARGLLDGPAVLERASELLRRLGTGFRAVFVAGFYSLTPRQADFLSALLAATPGPARVLFETPDPSSFSLSRRSDALYESFRAALASSGLPVKRTGQGAPARIEWLTAPDTSAELSAAARWVLDRLSGGASPADLAVVFPMLDHRADALRSLLSSRGVPCSVTGRPSGPLPAARFLAAALSLCRLSACGRAELEQLASSPSISPPPGYRAAWNALLARTPLRDAPLSRWAAAVREQAASIASSRRSSVDLAGGRISPAALLSAADELSSLLLSLSSLSSASRSSFPSLLRSFASDAAGEEAAAALEAAVEKVLRAAPSLRPVDAALAALDDTLAPPPPRHDPGAVAVSSMLEARHLLRPRLFLAGLTDGAFPFKRDLLPFLAEIESPRGFAGLDRTAESRHLFALFTSRPAEAVLCFPQAEGLSALKPSCFFVPPSDSKPRPAPLLDDEWRSASSLASLSFASPEWLRAAAGLVRLAAGRGARGAAAEAVRLFAPSGPFSGSPGRDARTAPLLDSLLAAPLHVTRVADYAACPLRFFFSAAASLRRGVGEEDPLSPSAWGSLLHDVLARFYLRWRSERGSEPLSSDPAAARSLLASVVADLAASPPPLPLLVGLLLDRMASLGPNAPFVGEFVEAEIRDSCPVPVELELPVSARVEGVELAGRIDRLDPPGPGEDAPVIVDYKTGAIPTWRKVEQGVEPQLPLYSLILEAKGGPPPSFCYYALSGKLGRRLPSRNYSEWMENARAAARQALASLAEALRSGSFPPREGDDSSRCPFSFPCRSLCAARTGGEE